MTRRAIYLAHPLGGDVERNVKRALDWLRFLMTAEPTTAFVAPWIAYVMAGQDDADSDARERGLLDDVAVVERCDGIVLCGGRISSGMQRELDAATARGLDVYDLLSIGVTAPRWIVAAGDVLIGGGREVGKLALDRWKRRGTRPRAVAESPECSQCTVPLGDSWCATCAGTVDRERADALRAEVTTLRSRVAELETAHKETP